jgi:hypothetical protein
MWLIHLRHVRDPLALGVGLMLTTNNCFAVTLAWTSAYVTDQCRQGDKKVTLKLWVHLSARISLGDTDNCAKGGLLVILNHGNTHVFT